VAVSGAGYVLDETLITGFSTQASAPANLLASFDFNNPYDIGAISLYLSAPVAPTAITGIEVTALYAGDPTPWLEVSLEQQGSNRGVIWNLYPITGDLLAVLDEMPAGGYCFVGAGCPEYVDLINIRVRPYDMYLGNTGLTSLQIYAVTVLF
jgi:hypothetical protein